MYRFLRPHDISNRHTTKETRPSIQAHHSLGKRQGCSNFQRPRCFRVPSCICAWLGLPSRGCCSGLVHIANPKLYSSLNPPSLTWNIQNPMVRCSSVQPRDFDFRLVVRFRVSHDCVPHCCMTQLLMWAPHQIHQSSTKLPAKNDHSCNWELAVYWWRALACQGYSMGAHPPWISARAPGKLKKEKLTVVQGYQTNWTDSTTKCLI